MKKNTTIILAVVVIAILVWYFFLKDKKDSKYTNYELDGGMLESGYSRIAPKCPNGYFPCGGTCCPESR